MSSRIAGYDFLTEHEDKFNKARINLAAITTSVTQWLQFGLFTCPAGLAFGLGYGDLSSQEAARGRIHLDLQTVAPAAIEGAVRVQILDPQGTPQGVFWQGRTDDLRLGATILADRVPFPEVPEAWIAQAYAFSFEILGDAAALINVPASTCLISMTQARVRRSVA